MNGWTNIWDILGISYTTDISEIKRAYAIRAKECHPEDHPEEFSRLQKAYKTAMQIAKNRKAYEKAMEDAGSKEDEEVLGEWFGQTTEAIVRRKEVTGNKSQPEAESVSHFDYSELRDEKQLKKQQAKVDLHKRLMYIIWNPYARNNVQVWDYFLHGQDQRELFGEPEFRMEFVRLLYQERFAGWHRDQILFFREYLAEFQLEGQPSPELQMRQWNWLLENSGTGRELLDSPCITSEEQKNYSAINFHNRSKMAVLHGELEKTKEEQYLTWYMAYAKKNEDKLRLYYRDWVTLRRQRFEHSDAQSILWRSLYMIWNPYVRNNISMWKSFLNEKRVRELFGDPGFRLMFARQICRARFAGWYRDQMAFLWQFLADFEPDGNLSEDFPGEEWSEIFRSAPKGGRGILSSFLTRKEKAAYDDLYTREIFESVDPEPGRSLEEQYLDWYWKYAEQNEEELVTVYEKWILLRKRFYYCAKFLRSLPAVAAVLLVLMWEIFVYKPYGFKLNRYQKMHEQFQNLGEDQEEQNWGEIKQQALEEFLGIRSQLDGWGISNDLIRNQPDKK